MPNLAESDRSNRDRAPYAPARGILVPILSLALSLPTILVGIAWVAAATYALLAGHGIYTGAPRSLPVPWPVCMWVLLGPLLALALCASQRGRAEELYGSALLLGYRIKRWNTVALWCAAAALLMLPVMAVVSIVVLSFNPQ